MKRSGFGLGLLLVVLLLGVVSSWLMVADTVPMAEAMEQAGEGALREDWGSAEAIFTGVRAHWDRRYPFYAAFTDHEPMEDINGLLAQLEIYARIRDHRAFAAVCAQISGDLEAIGEAHSLKWWNLL